MKRRTAVVLAFALVVLIALPAAAEDRRIVIPIEEFLPPDALAFVTVPDLMTVDEILERAGEGRETLAQRMTAGFKIDAGQVSILFEILAAASDAEAAFSLHPGMAGARPDFLVAAATARKGDHLEAAFQDLLRGFLIPRFGQQVREEQLGDHKLFHLISADANFYLLTTRGFVLASSSPLLLGRVLREMKSPSGKTLAHFARFAAARREAKAAAGGPHGFLYIPDPSRLPLAGRLGLRTATGFIARADGGFRDQVTLRAGLDGLLADLTGKKVSTSWSDRGGSGAWLTASLTPAGVMRLSQAVLGGPLTPLTAWIQDVAAGPVEVLFRPDAPAVLRIGLGSTVTDRALGPLMGVSRRQGNALLVSSEPTALNTLVAGEAAFLEAAGSPPISARMKARTSVLLELLGADTAGASGATVWQFRVAERSDQWVSVEVSAGLAEPGPFCILLASLFR